MCTCVLRINTSSLSKRYAWRSTLDLTQAVSLSAMHAWRSTLDLTHDLQDLPRVLGAEDASLPKAIGYLTRGHRNQSLA